MSKPNTEHPFDALVKSRRVQRVMDLGSGLDLWKVHIDELREQDKNAQSMDPETFECLAANIERDRRLEQLPFCAARVVAGKARIEIVSGHHRVRAARKANLLEVYVLVDVTNLARSKVISKQLAHNAIVGKSDEQILAELFSEMEDLEDMLASHIDPFALGVFEPMEAPRVEPVALEIHAKTVVLAFLPSQLEDFDEACKWIPPADEVRVLPAELYDKFEATMKRLGRQCNIKAIGGVVSRMCDLATEWLDSQPEPEAEAPPKAKGTRRTKGAKKKPPGARRKPAQSAIAAFAEAQRKAKTE